MRRELPPTHLAVIAAALVALAIGVWAYTRTSDSVPGIPEDRLEPEVETVVPTDRASCEEAGGAWNECASACPPDAEACILMCVQKCEGIGDGLTTFSAYFPNSKLDPEHLDCSVVFPVRRAAMARDGELVAAIESLLGGPNDGDRETGHFTSLPEDTRLVSLALNDGIARVELTGGVAKVAGSCRVASIRAQIEETLKQFSVVKSVVISVDGEVEEALQP